MFIDVTMVGLRCDNCGKTYQNENTCFTAFVDKQDCAEDAEEGGWHVGRINQYCPSCHEIDDEDNLILKNKKEVLMGNH